MAGREGRTIAEVEPEPGPEERRAIELALSAVEERDRAAARNGRPAWWRVGVAENVGEPVLGPKERSAARFRASP